jgi:polyisoprenoid-binding protein YceI
MSWLKVYNLVPLIKKKNCALLLFLTLTGIFSQVHAQSYRQVDWEKSKLGFQVTSMKLNDVNGYFKSASAELLLDLDRLGQSYIRISIPVSSIETGITARDENLMDPEYFDASQYKVIGFTSKKIAQDDMGNLVVTGILTIKGHEEKVNFSLSKKKLGGTLQLQLEDQIDRYKYLVGSKSNFMISRMIDINISLILKE